MTPPRQITPDSSFEVTRRTLHRTFRFLPTSQVRELVLYLLGVYAERHNITLYGFVLMITHYHLQGCDNEAQLPNFLRDFDGILARALNCLQGQRDSVWSGSDAVIVRPQVPSDLVSKIVYGMANPAAADLVNRVEDYPGVVISPDDVGKEFVIERPKFFFRENGRMPERVGLTFEVPQEFESMGMDAYRKMLWEQLRQREAEHRAERKATGRAVIGVKRLMKARQGDRSRSYETWFQLRPNIASKQKADRIAAIKALQSFRNSYRESLERWCAGERDVCFPVGTWWICRFAGAPSG